MRTQRTGSEQLSDFERGRPPENDVSRHGWQQVTHSQLIPNPIDDPSIEASPFDKETREKSRMPGYGNRFSIPSQKKTAMCGDDPFVPPPCQKDRIT